jgi:IPT/TIG domain
LILLISGLNIHVLAQTLSSKEPCSLLQQDFESGNAPGWDNQAPGDPVWVVVDGEYRRSNVNALLPNPYTIYRENDALNWDNYRLECDFRIHSATQGVNEIGFLFRFSDENNYYKLSFYCVNGGCTKRFELSALRNGSNNLLTSGIGYYDLDNNHLKIEVVANRIDILLNGIPLYNDFVTDISLATGSIGLLTNRVQTGFDNICVIPLSATPAVRPPKPEIYVISQYNGSYNQPLIITGANFGASRDMANGMVMFGFTPASIELWSNNAILVRAPEVSDEIIQVVAFDQISDSEVFAHRFHINRPVIDMASPGTISEGEVFSLIGKNFGYSQGLLSGVHINGTTLQVESWNNEEVRVRAPNIAAAGVMVFLKTLGGEHFTSINVQTTTHLTCEATPQSIILGESFTTSGLLTDKQGVLLDSRLIHSGVVSPSGVEIFADNNPTNLEGEYEIAFSVLNGNYPITQPGEWRAISRWSGYGVYQGAEARSAIFTVSPAATHLTAAATPSSFLQLNKLFRIEGTLHSQPDNPLMSQLLAGATVVVDATSPSGVVLQHIGVIYDGSYRTNSITADETGTWKIAVYFDGNAQFNASNRVDMNMHAAYTSGYAVIVTGRDSSGEGMVEHTRTTDNVWRRMIERSFHPEHINYLNSYGSMIPYANTNPASKGNVKDAIEIWAKDKMLASPAPLFVVFVNHGDQIGGVGRFHVWQGPSGGEENFITAPELDDWFDTLQFDLQQDPVAAEQPIIFTYGACHSGSFIRSLSEPGKRRILIASCDEYEVSYRGPGGNADRDGEYFISRFFDYASSGRSLKSSFLLAASEIQKYTMNMARQTVNGQGQNRYADGADQHPLLDDNGDGRGETMSLFHDGLLADQYTLGQNLYNPPAPISISKHSGDVYLAHDDADPELWLEVSDASQLYSVWIEIKSPTHVLSPAQATESFQREQNLPRLHMDIMGQRNIWRNWNQDGFSGFSASGEYVIYYFLHDNEQHMAPLHSSRVYRNYEGNQPPTPFSTISPASGVKTNTKLLFQWEASRDPEEGGVFYTLLVSTSHQFPPTETLTKECGEETVAAVGKDFGLVDWETYYWKVIARDSFGAARESSPVCSFFTDNTNDVYGSMLVRVFDGSDSSRITDATVQLNPYVPLELTPSGSYLGLGLPLQGEYLTGVSRCEYISPEPRTVVIRTAEDITVVDFYLYRPGDVNENGLISTSDIFSFAANWGSDPSPSTDVNKDGICDTKDLIQIIRFLHECKNPPLAGPLEPNPGN